jgi:hypothetical protein
LGKKPGAQPAITSPIKALTERLVQYQRSRNLSRSLRLAIKKKQAAAVFETGHGGSKRPVLPEAVSIPNGLDVKIGQNQNARNQYWPRQKRHCRYHF